MAAGDNIVFNTSDNVLSVKSTGAFVTGELKLDVQEASLGKIIITASADIAGKPCSFCQKNPSALWFEKESTGFCSGCIIGLFKMAHFMVKKDPTLNEIRVPCNGCGYRIMPSHGTEFDGKDGKKFLCDRCLDHLVETLESTPQPRKNILA